MLEHLVARGEGSPSYRASRWRITLSLGPVSGRQAAHRNERVPQTVREGFSDFLARRREASPTWAVGRSMPVQSALSGLFRTVRSEVGFRSQRLGGPRTSPTAGRCRCSRRCQATAGSSGPFQSEVGFRSQRLGAPQDARVAQLPAFGGIATSFPTTIGGSSRSMSGPKIAVERSDSLAARNWPRSISPIRAGPAGWCP